MKKGFIFVETIVVTAVLTVSLLTIYLTFSNVLSSAKRRVTFDDTGYMYRTYYLESFIESLELDRYINTYFVDEVTHNPKPGVIIRMFSCNEDSIIYNISMYDSKTNELTENPEYKLKKEICNNLMGTNNDFNVSNVYISRYNLNEVKECTTKKGAYNTGGGSICKNDDFRISLINLPVNMIYYLRSISSENTYHGTSAIYDSHGAEIGQQANYDTETNEKYYRLIVEYKETDDDISNNAPEYGPTPVNKKCSGKWKYSSEYNKCYYCDSGYKLKGSGDSAKCVKTVDKYYYNNVILVPKGDE